MGNSEMKIKSKRTSAMENPEFLKAFCISRSEDRTHKGSCFSTEQSLRARFWWECRKRAAHSWSEGTSEGLG